MDSGNTSGSMQSSSGDDQEHDSPSISAFLINSNINPSSSHVGSLPNPSLQPPQQSQQQQHHSSSSSMFDPLSNYFDNTPLSRSVPQQLTNPNSLLNFDLVWSKSLRSEPNCTDLGGFMTTSSPTQQFLTNQPQSSNRPTFGSIQFPQVPDHNNTTKGSVSGPVSGDTSEQTNNNMGVRNPKKRSRASRSAPTTVLTTDTTNFRAMVQEFTGIPAPPFTSSPFPRNRLDLFGTTSTLRTHLDPSPPPYLLRPFAQKIHPPTPTPFVSSSSSSSFPSSSFVDAIASSTTTTTNITSATNSNTSNSTSINYQLPQNLLNINMQNPVFNFNSILQPPPNKYQILGTTKPQGPLDISSSNDSHHLKMGVLEEFGLSHSQVNTNLGGLQNIVASQDTTTLPRSDSNPSNWVGGGLGSNEGDHHQHQGLLRSINGSYNNSQRVTTNGKVNNFSASSSDFHGDKGPENVSTRGEGMVESWICSSD